MRKGIFHQAGAWAGMFALWVAAVLHPASLAHAAGPDRIMICTLAGPALIALGPDGAPAAPVEGDTGTPCHAVCPHGSRRSPG